MREERGNPKRQSRENSLNYILLEHDILLNCYPPF